MGTSLTLSTTPRVAIVILNWNGGGLTLSCLRSVFALRYPNYGVLLVDNGSSDGSPEAVAAAFPAVTLLRLGSNLGFCEGNNAGLRHALQSGADYVLLLNNDTIVDPALLEHLVAACETDPATALAGPTMYYARDPERIAAAGSQVDLQRGLFWNQRDGELAPDTAGWPLEEVDYIVSCCVLVRREFLERAGLLDSRYFINGDDIDWGLRARAAGYKVVYVPAARMWHHISAAIGPASPTSLYYQNRNTFLLFATHLHGWSRLRALSLHAYRVLHTTTAWAVLPRYRSYREQRRANAQALWDAVRGKFGKR